MRVHLIAAARPNFMKIAPLNQALRKRDWCELTLVHTGQHYDMNMSEIFLQELGLGEMDVNLGVGSGSHGFQTGNVLIAYERLLQESRPDLVVVCGDVNSTLACALAAVKMGIPTAHLEAGLRSFDRTMPEEINRVATDAICDFLWTPSADADENLLREGVPPERIALVGNIMIDTLEMLRPMVEANAARDDIGLEAQGYALVTLHRPANVDDPRILSDICAALEDVAGTLRIIAPLHPRTRARLEESGLLQRLVDNSDILILEPLGYTAFMKLVMDCAVVVTDSGGVQEETSYLGIPCLTLRNNTERPVTLTHGTNRLVGLAGLSKQVKEAAFAERSIPSIPLWDGATAVRIADWIESTIL